jgi:adenylate kinase
LAKTASKRLILLGAPGVGKGTQAKRLAAEFGWAHISTGDILREAMRDRSALGEKVKSIVERGDLVPDEVMIEIVGQRLRQPDCRQGFVLDGFPRTVAQADQLDALLGSLGWALDLVLSIDVDKEEIIDRLSRRFTCEVCGPVVIGPSAASKPVCPNCGGPVSRRKDDEPETVRHRLTVYEDRTRSLIMHYRSKKLLRSIDGAGSVDDVFDRMRHALGLSETIR